MKGSPFSFQLGAGEVIKGWDLGVVGESRLLIFTAFSYQVSVNHSLCKPGPKFANQISTMYTGVEESLHTRIKVVRVTFITLL